MAACSTQRLTYLPRFCRSAVKTGVCRAVFGQTAQSPATCPYGRGVDPDRLMEMLDSYGFDSVVLRLLSALPLAVPIVLTIAFTFFVTGWISGLRGGLRLSRRAWEITSSSVDQIPDAWTSRAVLITILVWAGQMLTIWLCYVAGNVLALFSDEDRQASVESAFERDSSLTITAEDPWRLLTPEWIGSAYRTFASIFRFDTVPQVFVTAAALLILMSYLWARRDEDRVETAGMVLGLPALILLGISMLVGVLFLLGLAVVVIAALVGVEGAGRQLSVMILVGTIFLAEVGVSYLYYWICVTAVRSSRLVVLTWKPN